MVLAVVEVALPWVDVVDVGKIQGDVVVDLPVVAGVVINLLAGVDAVAEVDVGAPYPGVQAATVQQGGRTLQSRVVLRLRDAAGAVIAVNACVEFQGQLLA